MKVTDNPAKATNPGIKNVYRLKDSDGSPIADILALQGETIEPGKARVLPSCSGLPPFPCNSQRTHGINACPVHEKR